MVYSIITGNQIVDIVIWVLSGIAVFITGGGLTKLIREIKKDGKNLNLSELTKVLKKNFTDIKKVKETIDKEIKEIEKDK